MSIEFVCPTCSGTLRVGDESAGRVIRCGACLTMLRVPGTAPEPEPASAPAPASGDVPAPPPSPFESEHESAPAAAVPVTRPRSRDRDRDSDERPRRRRRRPPPPPGRGALFWLGLIGGLFVLLVGGCCGGLYFAVPGPKWHTHESAKGGFKVDLPAPARKDMDKIAGSPQDPGMTIEGTILFRALEEYAVVYRDLPPGDRGPEADKVLLDEMIRELKNDGELGPVRNQKDITVNGFPGREVEFGGGGNGYRIARLVVADGRLYMLVAGGELAQPGNENARRFVDSFEITDPKLRASGDKKVAAAKLAEELGRMRKAKEEQDRIAREKAEVERVRVEAARRKEEARIAEEKRKAEESRRRGAEAEAAKFRAARGGKAPPDPGDLPGLVLHLPFDEIKGDVTPTAPNGTAKLPAGATAGPGVRGSALYLAAYPGGVSVPNEKMPPELFDGKPVTVAGWVKTRDRAWCDLLTVPNAAAGRVLRTGFNDTGVWAQDPTLVPDDQWFLLPNERRNRPLHVNRPADEQWHHLVMVRRPLGDRIAVALYLDGNPIAVFPFGGGVPRQAAPGSAVIGGVIPLAAFAGKPSEFTFPRIRDGHFDVPDHDLPVAALDDVCAYGRALTDAEIRYLAGTGSKPAAEPKPIQLVHRATVDANSGVAFDPARGTMWAVTAVSPYWVRRGAPNDGPRLSYLKQYSYPDFKAGTAYVFPSSTNDIGVGGPPALDAKRNRLFVPISYENPQQARAALQRPWEVHDRKLTSLLRFDLDDLPEAKGGAAPRLTAVTARGGLYEEMLGSIVAPDGTLYYLDGGPFQPTNRPDSGGLAVSAIDAGLDGARQQVTVPRTSTWKGAFWMSPDGKTLRTITSGQGRRDPPEGAGVLEVDTATWKAKVLPLDGVDWTTLQSSAWHPDGRLFISDGSFGVLEFDLAAGTRRVRPLPLPNAQRPWTPTSFLQVSDDGRYLIASETEQKLGRLGPAADKTKNRVFVLDAARNATHLGAIGTAEETEDLRIGGPFWVSPDGQFIVFRSGVVLHIDDGRPLPKSVPRLPTAPAPRPVERD